MASDRGNKPKREGMYVYNIVVGGGVVPPPATAKNAISKGWGSLMRSKTYRDKRSDDNKEKLAAAAAGVVAEGGGEAAAVEGRKSAAVERRRYSVSATEGANVGSVAAFLQVKVLVSDMAGFMQVHAFRCARATYDSCFDKFSSKHMAYNIKKEFDKVYGPAWHCIVGSSFGSFVTHSTGCFLYFTMEKLYILLFKTKVQRAAILDQI